MRPARLENDRLTAWVAPWMGGGLLDLSDRLASEPLLRRAPPEPDDPRSLATRVRLDGPLAGAERAAWRILDRTPVTARLRHEPGPGRLVTLRYELVGGALEIELAARFGEATELRGAFVLAGPGPRASIEPGWAAAASSGEPGRRPDQPGGRRDVELPFNLPAAATHALSLALRSTA